MHCYNASCANEPKEQQLLCEYEAFFPVYIYRYPKLQQLEPSKAQGETKTNDWQIVYSSKKTKTRGERDRTIQDTLPTFAI